VILDPVIERARQGLAAFFDGAHGDGDVQLARGQADRAVLEVRWSGPLPPSFYARMEAAVKAGEIAGARIFSGKTIRPAPIGDPTPWMRGADDLPLELAPGGFAQASEAGNQVLVTRVDTLAASALKVDPSQARIIELYAGAGNLTVLLAKRADTYVAVESERDGCRAAENNLRARGVRAKVVEADADRYALPRGTHLVVLDPPRTGARAVAERLVSSLVRSVIYVSCDPQTLGRDLAILAPAYRAIEIEAFEMFPQTSHVEAVVLLESTSRDGRGKAGVA
jgi:23S rRNA (uracil1939-C5)-methyltransferase